MRKSAAYRAPLGRVLFVCFSEPVAGPEEILPHKHDHLRHLVAINRSDVPFSRSWPD